MTRPPADHTGVDRFRRWVPVLSVVLALYMTTTVTIYAARGEWLNAAFFGILGVGVAATAVVEAWPASSPRKQAIRILIVPAILCFFGVFFGALGMYRLVVGHRPWVALAGLVVGALCVAGGVAVFNRVRKLQLPDSGPPSS